MLKMAAIGGALSLVLSFASPAGAGPMLQVIDEDQARNLAKAGVLAKNDLRGYERERLRAGQQDDSSEVTLYKCLGLKAPVFAARNRGFSYASPEEAMSIETSADVASSAKAAKRFITAMNSEKAPRCLEEQMSAFAESNGASVKNVKITPKKISVSGADGAVAFRSRATFEGEFGSLKFHYSQIFLRVGPTEVSLRNDRYDGRTPGLALLASLTERLVKRVEAV